nr:hypothetical protein [Allomuricauda sp.]
MAHHLSYCKQIKSVLWTMDKLAYGLSILTVLYLAFLLVTIKVFLQDALTDPGFKNPLRSLLKRKKSD